MRMIFKLFRLVRAGLATERLAKEITPLMIKRAISSEKKEDRIMLKKMFNKVVNMGIIRSLLTKSLDGVIAKTTENKFNQKVETKTRINEVTVEEDGDSLIIHIDGTIRINGNDAMSVIDILDKINA